jgi:multiple sugar transport system permease protein
MATVARNVPGPQPVGAGSNRLWEALRRPFFYAILIIWAVIALAPLYFTLVFSLKPVPNVFDPPLFWPSPFTLDNFRTVLQSFELFPRWVLNSGIVSVAITAAQVLFCAMAGYAFARLESPLKNVLFNAMLISMMLPGVVTLIPKFLIVGPGIVRDLEINGVKIPTGFGLLDNLAGVVLPSLVAAFGVFMMTQFYKSIPRELEEAAMIDGAGRFGTFFRVILPISQTQLLTLGLLTFQGAWNSFMEPLILLRTPANFTLPLGLQWFRQEYNTIYSVVLAGSLFNTVPILVLFFLFQRHFVQGIAQTGSKEG